MEWCVVRAADMKCPLTVVRVKGVVRTSAMFSLQRTTSARPSLSRAVEQVQDSRHQSDPLLQHTSASEHGIKSRPANVESMRSVIWRVELYLRAMLLVKLYILVVTETCNVKVHVNWKLLKLLFPYVDVLTIENKY